MSFTLVLCFAVFAVVLVLQLVVFAVLRGPVCQAVLKTIFNFSLGTPPSGVPGKGPDCHVP